MSKRRIAFYAAFDDRGSCLGASTSEETLLDEAYAFLTKGGSDASVHPDGSPRLTFSLPCSEKFHAFVVAWRTGAERAPPLAWVHVPSGKAVLHSEMAGQYMPVRVVIEGAFS